MTCCVTQVINERPTSLYYCIHEYCRLTRLHYCDWWSNSDVFYEFIHSKLLYHLNPFDGSNPQSIVIMDNTSVEGIVKVIQQVGAMVTFLPPYSPDFNPIEELFSKVKKQFENNLQNNEMDLETIVDIAFCHMTPVGGLQTVVFTKWTEHDNCIVCLLTCIHDYNFC